MNPWEERWKSGRLGFHEGHVNATLREHWRVLDPGPEKSVLVPLCGKTHDLLFLPEKFELTVGVELIGEAITQFAAEHDISFTYNQQGPFIEHQTPGLVFLDGDMLRLSEAELEPFDAAFDRAALVALPDELRTAYPATLGRALKPGQ